MAEIIWVHLCDYAFSERSGKASIIGEFDRIYSAQFPSRFPQLFLALKIRLTDEERFALEVVFRAPDGSIIAGSTVPEERMKLIPGNQKAVFILAFYNLNLPEPGEYAVDIRLNGTTVYILPLLAMTPPHTIAKLPPVVTEKKHPKPGKPAPTH